MNDEKKFLKKTNFFLCLPLGRSNNMNCNKIYKTLVFTGLKTTLIHNKRHETSFITFNATFFSQKKTLKSIKYTTSSQVHSLRSKFWVVSNRSSDA